MSDLLDAALLRVLFLDYLTKDGPTQDRRKRDYNQAIFDAQDGWAIWNQTDLDMVMDKFDKAVRTLTRASLPSKSDTTPMPGVEG